MITAYNNKQKIFHFEEFWGIPVSKSVYVWRVNRSFHYNLEEQCTILNRSNRENAELLSLLCFIRAICHSAGSQSRRIMIVIDCKSHIHRDP